MTTPFLAAPPGAPLIDRLSEDDLEDSACIHRLTFPHAAISQLGLAVTERYHASLLENPGIVAWAAFIRSRLAGFCFGGTAVDVEGAFLRENLGFIARQILARPLLLTQPFIRERVGAGLRFLRPAARAQPAAAVTTPGEAPPRSFTIFYLAVHPTQQRRGIARALLQEAEQHALEHGFAQLDLSVYLDNTRAIEFYEHAGWRRRLSGGEWKGFMVKPLESTPAATLNASPARRAESPPA